MSGEDGYCEYDMRMALVLVERSSYSHVVFSIRISLFGLGKF